MIVYAIGDIHGQYDMLMDILGQIENDRDPNQKTTIVFLGDYVDRGPKSFEVVDHLQHLKPDENLDYIFLRGNHEQMLIEYDRGEDRYGDFMDNGGTATWISYDNNGAYIHDHIDWYIRLKWFHQIGRYVFVHAGIDPFKTPEQCSNDTLIWAREFNSYDGVYLNNMFVVHGHTPTDSPKLLSNQLNIDTGAAYAREWSESSGHLSAVRIDTDKGPEAFKFFKSYLKKD